MFLCATCGLNLASKKKNGCETFFVPTLLTIVMLVINYGMGRHAAALPTENIVTIAKV